MTETYPTKLETRLERAHLLLLDAQRAIETAQLLKADKTRLAGH